MMGYSLWYVKIDPPQNQDLNISLERPYKELLNELISFEIRYSKFKLWAVKEMASKQQKSSNVPTDSFSTCLTSFLLVNHLHQLLPHSSRT